MLVGGYNSRRSVYYDANEWRLFLVKSVFSCDSIPVDSTRSALYPRPKVSHPSEALEKRETRQSLWLGLSLARAIAPLTRGNPFTGVRLSKAIEER